MGVSIRDMHLVYAHMFLMYAHFGGGKGSQGNRGIGLLQMSLHFTGGMQLTADVNARENKTSGRHVDPKWINNQGLLLFPAAC